MKTIRSLAPAIAGRATIVAVAISLLTCLGSPAFSAGAANVFDDNWTPPARAADSPVASGTTGTIKVRPLPPPADVATSRALLKKVYEDRMSDSSPAGRRKLARALLDAVRKSAGNPTDQYALILGALRAAKDGSSLQLCSEATDALAGLYAVDALDIKSKIAFAIPLQADSPAVTAANVRAALLLMDDLEDAENFNQALSLGAHIEPHASARKDLSKQLTKRLTAIRATADLSARLHAQPDDPALNLAMGRQYCFMNDQWNRGLPLLAQGSDEALKKAAADELASAAAHAKPDAVADEWWTISDKLTDVAQGRVRQHAARLYSVALRGSLGPPRFLMEKRIALAAQTAPTPARGVDAVANASRIVFVLDATGSMMSSFDLLRVTMSAQLASLRADQRFDIMFINEHNPPPLAPELLPVTEASLRSGRSYVDIMAPRGSTDAAPSLKRAFDLKPDLILFMIDPTDFTKNDKKELLDLARSRSGGKIPIQVMAFEETEESEAFGKSLADLSGGTYVKVSNQVR